MIKKNPVIKEVSKFSNNWNKMGNGMIPKIEKYLKAGMPTSAAVKKAMKDVGYKKTVENSMMNTVINSYKIGAATTIANVEHFREWYLHKHWPGDKLTLSQRIAGSDTHEIIKNVLDQQLRANKAINSIAKSMTDAKLIKGDVSELFMDLSNQARKVAQGDQQAIKRYKSLLKKAERNIDKLTTKGARTERLKKAYANVIKASKELSTKQISKSIERAIKAKARYNAERIARTEATKAYGSGSIQRAKEDPDIKGIQWVLSPDHLMPDICDLHADTNMYGMGNGVYPIKDFPSYPAHPNCLCLIDDYYGKKKPKLNKNAEKKTLEKKSIKDQKSIMGIEGQKNFEKSPNIYKQEVPGYEESKKKNIEVSKIVTEESKTVKYLDAKLINKFKTVNRSFNRVMTGDIIKGAPENLKKAVLKLPKVEIGISKMDTAYYEPFKRKISFIKYKNESILDPAGHEYGHHFFHTKVSNNNKRIGKFNRSMQQDLQESGFKINSEKFWEIHDELEYIDDKFVSDYFGSLTKNKIGYGHATSYYTDIGKQHTEMFANLFETYRRTDRAGWNIIQQFSPNVAKTFVEIVNEIGG